MIYIPSPGLTKVPNIMQTMTFKVTLHSGLLIILGEKSQILRDLQRQIRRENCQFRGNFRSKFCRKAKKKESRKKIYWKDIEVRARKKTQKFIQHSSEGNCTCLERQEKHKLYQNTRPVNLLFQLQFRPCLYGLGYPRQPSPRATLAELTFHLIL